MHAWQMPMRHPNGKSPPARSPPTRIETPGSHVACKSVTRKCTVPPLPTSASPRPTIGWKRSM